MTTVLLVTYRGELCPGVAPGRRAGHRSRDALMVVPGVKGGPRVNGVTVCDHRAAPISTGPRGRPRRESATPGEEPHPGRNVPQSSAGQPRSQSRSGDDTYGNPKSKPYTMALQIRRLVHVKQALTPGRRCAPASRVQAGAHQRSVKACGRRRSTSRSRRARHRGRDASAAPAPRPARPVPGPRRTAGTARGCAGSKAPRRWRCSLPAPR